MLSIRVLMLALGRASARTWSKGTPRFLWQKGKMRFVDKKIATKEELISAINNYNSSAAVVGLHKTLVYDKYEFGVDATSESLTPILDAYLDFISKVCEHLNKGEISQHDVSNVNRTAIDILGNQFVRMYIESSVGIGVPEKDYSYLLKIDFYNLG